MRNVLLTGVGGQGTVLAAKVLAQAAQAKGWQVRTAETIGMAQRGGSVVSHVRMGDNGEEVIAPLVAKGTADMIIAFEPAEAARVLPYLAPDGVMGIDQVNRSQACGVGEQRRRTRLDTRRDDAAQKAPLLIDHLYVGRRAEVDDNDRGAE